MISSGTNESSTSMDTDPVVCKMSLTIPNLVPHRPFCYLNFISVAKTQKFGNETYDAHALASSKTYRKRNKPKKWIPNLLRYMSFWQVSLSFKKFLNLYYKKKGDALERGNSRGLKLTEQVMKVLERIVDGLIRQLVSIDNSQFGFVPGTTDAIFVVRQLQGKYLAANKRLYMVFLDLENAFDRVPLKVIWWALRKLDVEEWIVRLVQGCMQMCGAMSVLERGTVKSLKWRSVFTKAQYLARFSSSWCLKPLIREFHPWEDLYANDLVIIAESLEECVRRLLTWKEAMEKKGLRVNAGKTKIMICRMGLDLLQSSVEFPCAVCRTGVARSNSIFCNNCKHWVYKKCSGLKRLTKDPDYRCTRCQGTACPLDGRPQREVQVGPDKLEVVASFCYLGHMLSAAGGCELPTTTREKRLEEVQGAATSSLFTPPLFQDTWPCVQLFCAERNAPCQWDLAIDKTKPPMSAAEWQGNDQKHPIFCKKISLTCHLLLSVF